MFSDKRFSKCQTTHTQTRKDVVGSEFNLIALKQYNIQNHQYGGSRKPYQERRNRRMFEDCNVICVDVWKK